MAKPLVAIVGRPNVGKSMLFNKLTGHRTSIVEDTPGVTRDRIYGDCEWCGRTFSLVDTGGIEPGTENDMLKFMRRQAEIGIELADAIVMVVDVRSGVTAADQDVATMLRKAGKPVALAVNKCDSIGLVNPDVFEFYSLGIGDLFETSAVHGHGTGDLLDWVLANVPEDDGQEEEDDIIKVAIVGKPNVGKSSQRPDANVFGTACPLFVPLVENGRFRPGDPVIELVAREYLQGMIDAQVDTLVLGCTHYPLLSDVIGQIMGPDVTLISSGSAGAAAVKDLLRANHSLAETGHGDTSYFVSDSVDSFERTASLFLGSDLRGMVQQIDIEKY